MDDADVKHYETGREAALISLLDDPSTAVQSALLKEFQQTIDVAVDLLRRIAESGEMPQAEAARYYLRELGAEDTTGAFIAFIRSYQYELETGSILLDRTLHPHVEPSDICVFLDEMADRVRELMVKPATPFEQCRILNRVIFHEYGFAGDQDDFYHPHNCFLHKVIERRRGLPISLSIIYLLVAYRCGIELDPVGMPGRFMVGCFTAGEPFYIDVFEGGAFRTREDLDVILEGFQLPPEDNFFMPLPVGDVILRCCRNLVNQFTRSEEAESARLFANFVNEFESAYQQQD
ncbi:transglutaminase-like domain-containing protein [Rubellicoccus peritrichatus]|uniref:Transglutaminase-like domain-containing protein n=1 Tax=Rubellicoccus peritrichatus TaxID=3080537 RepID=A0AAQ3QTX0_9BACT|nr:transglutaminase-like domain-containing protein [Puniceicoccus sp. CR14]WOO41791.1 transglutaminase-like domain-containing protein [Puniceicoccus sp. CR14]